MFNFQVFAANLLAAVANTLQNNFTTPVKQFIEETLASKEERLKDIAQGVLDKQIDLKDVPEYAKVELNIAEADLLAIGILTATEAQDVINALVEKGTALLNGLVPTQQVK